MFILSLQFGLAQQFKNARDESPQKIDRFARVLFHLFSGQKGITRSCRRLSYPAVDNHYYNFFFFLRELSTFFFSTLLNYIFFLHIRFICKTCDSCFTQSTSLKRHVAKRSCFKNFSCSFCEYTTTRKEDWDQHIQLHKKEEDKSECSSTLSAPADSAQQNSSPLNVQLKETSFTCPNCPFETKWEQSLRRHKRTHHGITMESCWSNFSGKKSCRKRRAPNHRLR